MFVESMVKLSADGTAYPIVTYGRQFNIYSLLELNLKSDDDWVLATARTDTITVTIPINRQIYKILKSLPPDIDFVFESYKQLRPYDYESDHCPYEVRAGYCGVIDDIGHYTHKDSYQFGRYIMASYAFEICVEYFKYKALEKLLEQDIETEDYMRIPHLVEVNIDGKPSDAFDVIEDIVSTNFDLNVLGIHDSTKDAIIRIVRDGDKLRWKVNIGDNIKTVKLKDTECVYLAARYPGNYCPLFFMLSKKYYKVFRKLHHIEISVAAVTLQYKKLEFTDIQLNTCVDDFVFAREYLGMMALLLACGPFILSAFKQAHQNMGIHWDGVEFAYEVHGSVKDDEVIMLPDLYVKSMPGSHDELLSHYIQSILIPWKKGIITYDMFSN